jgi:hypothetical protein
LFLARSTSLNPTPSIAQLINLFVPSHHDLDTTLDAVPISSSSSFAYITVAQPQKFNDIQSYQTRSLPLVSEEDKSLASSCN